MASPFSVFRKRQKLWMMVACFVAIVAFVFLPNLSLLGRSDAKGRENLVVVKTKKFGDLRQSDLRDLLQRKQKVRAVLVELRVAAGQESREAETLVNRVFGGVSENELIDTWLKVRRAQEMGMVVSNSTITQFLEQWTEGKVNLDTIHATIGHTPPVSDDLFYDLLRDEWLARRLMEVFAPSIEVAGQPTATPSQRWDWFNRVNRMAVIEAVPLAVSNYVKDVKDPGDDVLKAFFEENKETLPNPTSPQPGFKRPQKVAIEYFKADAASFAAKVTDAEILKEYEKYKDEYDQRFRIPPPKQQEAVKGGNNAKKANAAGPRPESKTGKVVPKAKTPAIEPKKEPATPEMPKAGQKKEPDKTSPARGTSSSTGRSPFTLVAMQAEKPAKSPAAPEPAVKSATPSAKPESPDAKPESPDAKPEKPAAKEQKPAAKEQKPATKEQQKTEQKPAAKGVPTQKELVDELPVALKTFIRQRLAIEKIQNAFEALNEPVKEYQEACKKYDLLKIQYQRTKKKLPPPPARPDFEKLAKENGLSTGQTKLLSDWEARDTDVGASITTQGGVPVWYHIYKASKFRSEGSSDANAVYYLWKSEDVKEEVPSFHDKGVREEALHSWKMIQARSLARKAAKLLADEANKAAKPLKQVCRNRMDLRVALPPKFSWLTVIEARSPQQRPQVRLSPVADVPMAGDDFMAAVFQLEPGQAGVAFNAPETVVYVVRPSEFTPSYEVRWRVFLADSFASYASAGSMDQLRVMRAWGEEIKKSAGFEWGPGHKATQGDSSQGVPSRSPVDDED
jgi:hypothetical protein